MHSKAAGEEGWGGETPQFVGASSRGTLTAREVVHGQWKGTL